MPHMLEVWNDTVDGKHLIGSIAIGVGIAVPAYLIADRIFADAGADGSLGHSYALLVGILGCIVGAVISGLLFKPKRVITESATDTRNRQEVIDDVVEEYGELGDPRELGSAAQAEIRAVGLFDALLENHEKRARDAEAAVQSPGGSAHGGGDSVQSRGDRAKGTEL